ncbi:hypothetical protein ENBRE01_3020 [Enteropsectra breve]|nr:hypothetical protein ENBRE01_3020 [Enteropsectra breve]
MRIFHILITVISCLSYTANPLEMLLVHKKDLEEIVNKKMSCTLCGTNICQNKNESYDDSNKTSFMNYCFNHFRCSCCASVFHANCFVRNIDDKFATCPNPYCSSMYSLSEMERFFGQLLLSYAYNNEPIKEYKNMFDEYRLRMFKDFGINANLLWSKPITFAYLAKAYEKREPETKINRIIEEIVINTLINGRMAHALMDSVLWNKLGDYLISKINYPLEQKEYIKTLMGSDMTRPYHKKFDANKKPIFSLRDKLYKIRTLVNAMNPIEDKPKLHEIYNTYIVNPRYKEISALRATYFFVCLFQKPDALLVIEETGIQLSEKLTKPNKLSIEIRDGALDEFKWFFRETLMGSSEALFRKLYTDYIFSKNKGSMTINLDPTATNEINYLVKWLVRLVLGVGHQPAAYFEIHKIFIFKSLNLCCVKPEIKLLPGEICSALKWFSMNNKHITKEEQNISEYFLKWMLEIPISPGAIALFQGTLISNYSSYLGRIYAKYIPCDTLVAICGGDLQNKFKDADSALEFEKFVLEHKSIIM